MDWESDIYAKGDQLNLWPFTEVVSVMYRELSRWSLSRPPRVLEIGSGAGNNLWALASAGFDCFGIDPSQSAVAFARSRFDSLGLQGSFQIAKGQDLPFIDEFFDFVIDRAAICQIPRIEIPRVLNEALRVMAPGAAFYSFGLFGSNHSDAKFGQLTESGSYDNFSKGIFSGVGLTTFFDRPLISELFSQFESLEVTQRTDVKDSGWTAEEFAIRCAKASSAPISHSA